MEVGDLTDDERAFHRRRRSRHRASGATLEHMLTEASQMLSGMSRGAGLVLAAKNGSAAEAHRVHPARAEASALAVLVSHER
jgi:heat-inducible transcriptional repressor